MQRTNGLNGSASSSTANNNNNIAKSELINGNDIEAAKNSTGHDNLNAASKDELYDVPVGEFRISVLDLKSQSKKKINQIDFFLS